MQVLQHRDRDWVVWHHLASLAMILRDEGDGGSKPHPLFLWSISLLPELDFKHWTPKTLRNTENPKTLRNTTNPKPPAMNPKPLVNGHASKSRQWFGSVQVWASLTGLRSDWDGSSRTKPFWAKSVISRNWTNPSRFLGNGQIRRRRRRRRRSKRLSAIQKNWRIQKLQALQKNYNYRAITNNYKNYKEITEITKQLLKL